MKSKVEGCDCCYCRPITLKDMRFVVCPECHNKLRNKPFTEIRSFMQSPKPNTVNWYCDWEELLEREFKSRWED